MTLKVNWASPYTKCHNVRDSHAGRDPTLPKDARVLSANTMAPQTQSWWRQGETKEKEVATWTGKSLKPAT